MREFPFMVFLSTFLAHRKFSKLNKISSMRETYMGKEILFELFDNVTIASEDSMLRVRFMHEYPNQGSMMVTCISFKN